MSESDSDSDCEALNNLNGVSPTKGASSTTAAASAVTSPSKTLVVAERERRMRYLITHFPELNSMDVHERLAKVGFDLTAAITELKEIFDQDVADIMDYDKWKLEEKLRPQQRVVRTKRPTETKKTSKAKRRRVDNDSDSDSAYRANTVYDSDDDSDIEVTDELTPDKRRVLDFMQTATPKELQMMHSCSKRKVDAILEARPFAGWVDLFTKLQTNKNLSPDLLNAAQRVLATRNNVQALMRKCTNIAEQMERAVKHQSVVPSQPKSISAGYKLTSYQLVGINWLSILHEQGLNGILADEMGLGKTVQVVTFLARLKERGVTGQHLIVVPASTLENWQNEFARWCPSINVLLYYGNMEERRQLRMMFANGTYKEYDVVLTTYNIVASTPEERKMFRVTPMHYVVFDEAHMLKNMKTARYEALSRMRATRRLLLTGTPLQNNLLELMSLLIFVMPNIFSAKTEDLKSLFQTSAKKDKEEDDVSTFEREQIEQAKRIMKPFVLRRLKNDVLKDLPEKTDELREVVMEESQERKYVELVAHFQEVGEHNENGTYNGMSMMTDLRKLANHPLLLRYHYMDRDLPTMAKLLAKDPDYKDTVEQYIIDDLACMSDYDINEMTKEYMSIGKYALPKSLIPVSGKFQYLDKNLPEMKRDGHRVLIFSQYVIVLNILEDYMKLRKHSYLRLDGSTPVTTRQQLIDEYTNDTSIFVFLLSTRAGGLGINLTAADTVIIHDIDFNPYNDKQAEDRCHRMGQMRPVRVIRLVAKDTIEEGMWALTQEKLKLEREITSEDYEATDLKSVVSLLSTALKMDQARVNNLVSPEKARTNGTAANH